MSTLDLAMSVGTDHNFPLWTLTSLSTIFPIKIKTKKNKLGNKIELCEKPINKN